MKLTPVTLHDIPRIQTWLSNESLFYTMATEKPDFQKPIYAFMIRLEDGTAVGWV